MAENKKQLLITIGAALSGGFNSVISGSTSKLKEVGNVIKNMERQSILGASAVDKLKLRYNSFLGSVNKQQAILQKRAFYRSQIMEIVALGAAFAAPIKKAMDFEKAMDGVRSVVNFKEPDGLKKLGDTLSELSTKLPMSATELANIAAVGGRFGVAESQLGAFAEKVGKATYTWGFAADEGAEKISNLMKIMGWSTQDLGKQFDIINELGNRTGATANEIVRSIIKSSSGLSAFKFTTAEVGALVSTFKSMGQTADEAGATLNTILQKLSVTGSLGRAGAKAFHRMGIGIHGFAKEVGESPQKAIMKLLEGLSKLDDVTRRTALNDIFGKRAAMNVGLLVQHLKTYKENLHAATNMKNVSGSFGSDYSHAATASGNLKTFLSSLENVTRKIGDILIGPFKGFLSIVTNGLNRFSKFMDKNGELVKNVILGISALIGLKIGIFALGYASTFLLGGFNRLVIVGKGLLLGLTATGIAGKALLVGFLKLVGGIVGISSGFLGLSQTLDGKIQFSFKTLIDRVKWLSSSGKTKIKSFFESIKSKKLSDIFNEFKLSNMSVKTGSIKESTAEFGQVSANIGVATAGFWLASKLIGGVLRGAFSLLSGTLSIAGAGLKAFGSLLRFSFNIVKFGVNTFGWLCQISWFFATTVLPFVFKGIGSVGSGLLSLGKILLAHPILAIGAAIAATAYLIYKNWEPIKGFFTKLWNEPQQAWSDFKNWISETWNTIVSWTSIAISKFKEFFEFLKFGGKFIVQVGSILGDVWENISAIIDKLYFGGDSVIPAWESVKNFFKNIWKDIAPSWDGFFKYVDALNVGEKIKSGWEKLKEYLKGFFDWIKGPLESFFKPSLEMLDKLKGWLPKIGGEKTSPQLKIPRELKPANSNVTRNQNNNFSITINANKNDNPEAIANKVVNRVSDYSKTFLYDEAAEAI